MTRKDTHEGFKVGDWVITDITNIPQAYKDVCLGKIVKWSSTGVDALIEFPDLFTGYGPRNNRWCVSEKCLLLHKTTYLKRYFNV